MPKKRKARKVTSRSDAVDVEEALSSAIAQRDLRALLALLDDGVDEEVLCEQWGDAIGAFCEAIILALMQHAPLDCCDTGALYEEAARAGSSQVVRRLLDAGAELSDDDGRALKIAILSGHASVVKVLIDAGVDTRCVDGHKNTALMMAVESKERDIIDLAMNACELDETNDESQTALMVAAVRGDQTTVDNLLEAGARTDLQDSGGGTALTYAVRSGAIDIVRLLLDRGADANEEAWRIIRHRSFYNTSRNQRDPVLVVGAKKGHDAVCQVLLENGADVNRRSSSGRTAPRCTLPQNTAIPAWFACCSDGERVRTSLMRRGLRRSWRWRGQAVRPNQVCSRLMRS